GIGEEADDRLGAAAEVEAAEGPGLLIVHREAVLAGHEEWDPALASPEPRSRGLGVGEFGLPVRACRALPVDELMVSEEGDDAAFLVRLVTVRSEVVELEDRVRRKVGRARAVEGEWLVGWAVDCRIIACERSGDDEPRRELRPGGVVQRDRDAVEPVEP